MNSFDEMVGMFETNGLSREAAEIAARGRDYATVAEAREAAILNDRLTAAQEAADETTAYAPPGTPPALAEAVALAESAARTRLGMPFVEAREYVEDLTRREVARRGDGGAARWLKQFAGAVGAGESR